MKVFYTFILAALLAACGGSGGGNSNGGNASSSEPAVDPNSCDGANGVIFAECVNAYYGKAWGASYSPTWEPYETSQPGNQVQWAIVDGDSEHKKVMEVSFASNEKRGIFVIGADTPLRDLSAYKGGTYSFDIRVLNGGDAADPITGQVEINTRTECVYPCASHYSLIKVPNSNSWMHVEIPVKDLIASGMDITKITNPLQFSTKGFNQKNLRVQIDNVKYTKGNNVLVEPKAVFKEDFNQQNITNWTATTEFGTPEVHTWSDVGAVALIFWSGVNDAVHWQTTLPSTIDITNKKASYQIFCAAGSTPNFMIAVTATDENGNTATGPASIGSEFPTDTWMQLNFEMGNSFSNGFNAKKVAKLGVRYTPLSSAVYTFCWVDTIRITE